MADSKIQQLVEREPWRTGQGQPRNALDPTWQPQETALCDGPIEWEGGDSRWWFCMKCGYCGCWSRTEHEPAINPLVYFLNSISQYFDKRTMQGAQETNAIEQALFVAGAALRYAATEAPSKIGDYVHSHIIKR